MKMASNSLQNDSKSVCDKDLQEFKINYNRYNNIIEFPISYSNGQRCKVCLMKECVCKFDVRGLYEHCLDFINRNDRITLEHQIRNMQPFVDPNLYEVLKEFSPKVPFRPRDFCTTVIYKSLQGTLKEQTSRCRLCSQCICECHIAIPILKEFCEDHIQRYGISSLREEIQAMRPFTDHTAYLFLLQFTSEVPYVHDTNKSMHSTWVNLDLLCKQISEKRKGEKHRVIKDLIPFIEKTWTKTLRYNSNKRALQFVRICRDLNLNLRVKFDRDEKYYRAQMFAFNTFMRIPQTLNNLQDASDSMFAGIQHLGVSVDGFSNNFDQFNVLMHKILDRFSTTLEITDSLIALAKLLAIVFLMYEAPKNASVLYYASVLALAIPTTVVGMLSENFMATLMRAVQTVRDYFTPVNRAQVDTDGSVVRAFFDLTKWVFFGLFRPIDIESYRQLTISSGKVKIIGDYLKNTSTIFEYTLSLCKWCSEFITSGIIKYYGYLPSFFKEDIISKVIQEYQTLLNDHVFEKCHMDIESAKKVLDFNARMVKLEGDCYSSINDQTLPSFKTKVLPYIRFINMTVQKIISDIPPHIRDGFEGFRKKPYWVYLHGESNIGKSGAIQPLIASALAAKLKLVDKFDDPHNYSFFRVCGREFFGNYRKQPIIQYNDLFQDYANAKAINEAIIELTNIVDEAPYELNMPDVESKGKIFCTSPIVLSNAQSDFISEGFIADRCWSGGIHLYRRRNIVVEPMVYRRYKHSNNSTPGIDWNKVQLSLQNGVASCKYLDTIPHDLYNMRFTDPVSGIVIRQCNLEAAIDFILQDAEDYFKSQNNFHDNLIRNMKSAFGGFAQMDNFSDAQTPEEFQPVCGCIDTCRLIFMQSPLYMNDQLFRDTLDLNLRRAHNTTGLCGLHCTLERGETFDEDKMAILCAHFLLGTTYNLYTMLNKPSFFQRIKYVSTSMMQDVITVCKSAVSSIFNWKVLTGIAGAFALCVTLIKIFPTNVTGFMQTDEGSRSARKAKIVRRQIRATAHESTVATMQYDNSNRVVEEVLVNNFCTFTLKKKIGGEYIKVENYMHALCLGGSVFVLPKHYWHIVYEIKRIYRENNIDTALFLIWHQGAELLIPWDNIDVFTPDQDYLVDVLFVRIRRLAPRRSIIHFFVNSTDPIEDHEAYLYGLRSRTIGNSEPTVISVDGTKCVSVDYIDTGHQVEEYGKTTEMFVKTPVAYEYFNCKTVGGDCGSVLVFVNPKLNSRVLAGIHVGGNPQHNTGFAAPIFREDLDEVYQYFNTVHHEITITSECQYNECQMDNNSTMLESLSSIGVNIVGRTTKYKNKRIKCVIPRKSKISRSLCFDLLFQLFGPNTHMPALLRPTVLGDQIVSPFILAYGKMKNFSPLINEKVLVRVRQHVANTIRSWHSIFTSENYNIEVLDDGRAINGIPGMKMIDLSTSPGFPYVFEHNGLGKRPWFDHFETVIGPQVVMNEDLKKIVYEREALAKQGIIYETYYIDTLKDETRPIVKVKEGKTRLFQIGPMDLTILMRKYFGCFIAHLHTTFRDGECGVGINCLSSDWDHLVRRMTVFESHICGDHKDFDYNTGFQLAMEFAEQANLFYADNAVNCLVRRVLVATCVGMYHIVDTNVIFCEQGNNSGNLATTDINDNTNMYINRIAYYEAYDTMRDYDRCIRSTYYGDDSWLSIHPEIIDRFNGEILEEKFQRLGFKYTAADKGKIKKKINLSEVTYLKRHVLFREDLNLYVGVLPKEIIQEIPRWSESDPHNMADQLNRFNSALIEASQYGEDYYNFLLQGFTKCIYALQVSNNVINANNLLEYNYIMHKCYPDYFCYLKEFTGGTSSLLSMRFSDSVYYSEERTVE